MDTLDLSENLLSSVPAAILSCSQLRLLLLAENVITYVQERAFQGLQFLQWVDLRGNPLLTVHHRAFSNLPSLNKLILKETRDLSTLPDLLASVRLEVLGIDRASLASVPHDFCLRHPRLRSLNLHLNALQVLPDLSKCNQLKLLGMSTLDTERTKKWFSNQEGRLQQIKWPPQSPNLHSTENLWDAFEKNLHVSSPLQ
ncbi:Leucine-rich repeat [Trinorchestia longiramus]|nr:Leucine-rich repeat [Trinorchestia longiramus]